MKTQDSNPFHRKLSIIYILILFATLLGGIWWTRHNTRKPEIIDPNIATTEQTKKLPVALPILSELMAETKEIVFSGVRIVNTG